jgi:hypothetical protein
MAMNLPVPEDLKSPTRAARGRGGHVKVRASASGANLILQRHARRREISEGLDFVMSHDAELLTRLEDA